MQLAVFLTRQSFSFLAPLEAHLSLSGSRCGGLGLCISNCAHSSLVRAWVSPHPLRSCVAWMGRINCVAWMGSDVGGAPIGNAARGQELALSRTSNVALHPKSRGAVCAVHRRGRLESACATSDCGPSSSFSSFSRCLVGARFSGVINFHAKNAWGPCRMRFAVGGTAIRFRSPGRRRPARVPPLEPRFICHGRSGLR